VGRFAARTIGRMPDQESRREKIDRELIELLNELRVALPGVQVLFAFLLILPFQQRFSQVGDVDRLVYLAALLSSAAAGALLIAPSVYHRVNFRRRNKERILLDSNALLIAGSAFTGIGIVCAIFVIGDVLFGFAVALALTLATTGLYVALWVVLPLVRRREPDD
jgi:Family of unknown function (DUF6328)